MILGCAFGILKGAIGILWWLLAPKPVRKERRKVRKAARRARAKAPKNARRAWAKAPKKVKKMRRAALRGKRRWR